MRCTRKSKAMLTPLPEKRVGANDREWRVAA